MFRESLTFTTADGFSLEGELASPDEPVAAAVLAHPNPPDGGNMRSFVPGELIKALPDVGHASLRFNFRGVGESEGAFEDGKGEIRDIEAAIDTLEEITEGLPIAVYGSSFGADTALSTLHPQLYGWVACAPVLRDHKIDRMMQVAYDPRPKFLIVPARDQLRKLEDLRAITRDWTNTTIEVVPGADHYFIGKLEPVVDACKRFAALLA